MPQEIAMNPLLALATAAFAAFTMSAADVADAARLGGGRSMGAQRQSIAPPAATPAPSVTPPGAATNPVMPAQPGMAAAKTAAPAAASGASRWLGPIAGLAAGIGLAALLSHFGLSESVASFLMLALLVVVAVVVFKWIFGRRAPPARSPMQYAGSGSSAGTSAGYETRSPAGGGRFEPVFGGAGSAPAKFPPGFDAPAFAEQAKQQFHRLQAAYDRNDRGALRDVMTPEMFADVARDIDSRGAHVATVVDALDAEVLDVATEGDRYWASVRFTGSTREGGGAPQAFDEVWNLSKPTDGSSGWLLAGIQQQQLATA